MRMKTIAMMMAAGCAVTILTGCGVPQEEYDAKVADLNTAWAEIETLKGTITDKESLLSKEEGKVRSLRIELDDTSKRIAKLKTAEATTATALAAEKAKISDMESAVASAESATRMAKDRTSEAEAALAALQEEFDTLQVRFDQFEKNMRSIDSISSPTAAPKAAAESDPSSALDLLNEMSVQ